MKKIFLMSVVLIFLAAGCTGIKSNVVEVQGDTGAKRVVINDKDLAGNLELGQVGLKPVEGGGIEAQVYITNKTRFDLPFEYRFIWLDKGGFELSSLTAWIPVVLGGRESRGYKSVSPAPDAVNFKVEVRKSHAIKN